MVATDSATAQPQPAVVAETCDTTITNNKSFCEKIQGALVRHWTINPYIKKEKEIAAEKSMICVPILCTDRIFVFKAIPFNRWQIFFASFFIHFCCGSLYAWSIYNVPIDEQILGDSKAGKAVITFYLSLATHGVTAAILGPWIENNGPRMGMLAGLLAFFFGHIISAIAIIQRSMILLYVGYGLFVGFGLGMCYISPISALQKWFPDMRGTASGFAISGFGAGAIVCGKLYLPLKEVFGLPGAFVVLGTVMTLVMSLGSVTLRTPPLNEDPTGKTKSSELSPTLLENKDNDFSIATTVTNSTFLAHAQTPPNVQRPSSLNQGSDCSGVVSLSLSRKTEGDLMAHDGQHAFPVLEEGAKLSKVETNKTGKEVCPGGEEGVLDCLLSFDYLCLYGMFFTNAILGLVVLSHLSDMVVELFEKSDSEGANIVAFSGALNCAGRLLFPLATDVIVRYCPSANPPLVRKCAYAVTLLTQIFVAFTLPSIIAGKHYTLFLVDIFIVVFVFAGGLSVIPSLLSEMYTPKYVAALHGMLLTWSTFGVGVGFLFNSVLDSAKNEGRSISEGYIANFKWLVIVMCFGNLFLLLVRTNPEDRKAPGFRYSLFGKIVFHIQRKSA